MTRLARHLSIGADGDLAWRFSQALYFANLDLIRSFR